MNTYNLLSNKTALLHELSSFISGENVKVGGGNARVFVYDDNNHVELRSNVSYDETVKLLEVKPVLKL